MNDRTSLASDASAVERLAAGRPSTAGWWWLFCGVMVAAMAALRLTIYPDQIVPLTYALPLLVCLWNRDLRLLWGMAGAFVGIVALKFVLALPEGDLTPQSEWVFGGMQLANILIAAGVIHLVIRLTGRLEATIALLEKTNAELDATNEELSAREEEITQQNEELQCQAEELEQQTEELNVQTEELQTLNEQLAARERTVGELLESFAGGADEREMLAKLGEMVLRLFGDRVSGAAVLEAQGDSMVVRPLTGIPAGVQRLKRSRTLADLVFTRDRAGFLADLTLRPDLEAPTLAGGARVRSLAAAPFRVADAVTGALEVYRAEPGAWSEHDQRIVQWLAEQCGRAWTTVRLRDALEDQRRLLRTVTETSSVALFMVDEDDLCTYVNRAAEALLGYTLKELQQRPLHQIIRARAGGAPAAFASMAVGEQRQGPQDDVFIRKGGGEVPVRVVCSAVESGGRVTGKVIEARDATELNRHEEEREHLLEAERQARAEAERANRTKDEFVATLSHELRTPLNAMMGWASLLRKSDCSDVAEVQQGLEIIERNARQQGQLISDLLDISRITAGKIRLDIQAVDVPLVIESALEAVRPAAEAKGVRLERVVETLDRAVTGDPNRLQQVVWNLLSNAIKFTPRDGRVQVVVSRVASYVQITVSDTGEGIDPALLPHLFERYRQADGSSTRRHSGLGLGLAIAKNLVELHGGSIHARSDGLGAGAAFSVLLPVRAAEPHESVNGPHPRAESARPWDGPAPDLDGVAVLVVDDEQDARDLIRRVLREHGAAVACAASGEEALDLLAVDPPGMLVSDIGMPGMDGYALIRTIHERWPHLRQALPAIALTAFARSEDRTRALLAGFRAHVAKPVDSAELVATVAALRVGDHIRSHQHKRSE